MFEKSKWIWAQNSLNEDDYAEFIDNFESESKEVVLNISCDTVYAVYLNNKLIKFMGCFDYNHFKLYDEVLLKLKSGFNKLVIDVWHYGYPCQTYEVNAHGLIYEIYDGDVLVSFSSKNTLSRVMNEFKNGYKKVITSQQGLSFLYDSRNKNTEFSKSIELEKNVCFNKREINDIELFERDEVKIFNKEKSILIDLGKETAGLLELDLVSPCDQLLTISYGEHIKDGGVRRFIGDRDFSVEYFAQSGSNNFLNPLKRIAGRYIEIFYDEKPIINYAGIRKVNYAHKVKKIDYNNELINKINKVCIDTLELCMHEHYEDCPWREQCLYILDSSNQMLSGYHVFEGFEYARHNLLLISNSINEYGFYSLCVPSTPNNLVIPFFNLIYLKSLNDYVTHSNDYSILEEVKISVDTVINNFLNKIDSNNLIPYFKAPYWNFYDWVDEHDNVFNLDKNRTDPKNQYDLIINAAFVYAINLYNKLYEKNIDTSKIKKAIQNTFYLKKSKRYIINTNSKASSQLATAFVCLIGLGNEEIRKSIKNDQTMIKASLSNMVFVYDALLIDSNEKDYVISDICQRYKKMLDDGATSFYETEDGADAFDGAGSLCHGWSSLPIYYFAKILKE